MNICKPPDPLSLTGNVAKNWKDLQTVTSQDDQLKQLKHMIEKGRSRNINNVPQVL